MTTARRRRKRRIEALRRLPLVRGCTNKELAQVDWLGSEIEIAPGRTLTSEGDDGLECVVVLEGIATVHQDGEQLGSLRPGSIAGEMALIDGAPRNATVVARTPMRLLVLSRREFKELLDVAPCIRDTIDAIAAERRAARSAKALVSV